MGLYFFSGKGGVGKTHLSTGFAFNCANAGKKVLLVEFSQQNQYTEYFSQQTGFEPVEYTKNLFISSWTGKDCLREYVGKILRSQRASDFFMKISAMEKLIDVAPGLKEIAVLGKLTSDYRDISFSTDFDDIVFDAPASGHFVALLNTPASLGSVVGAGPMKTQCTEILEVLNNQNKSKFILVEDGSGFSVKEADETQKLIKEILPNQTINSVRNHIGDLDKKSLGGWFESAKESSTFWKDFKWS